MIANLFAVLAGLGAAPSNHPPAADATYVDASMTFEGELLGVEFVELDPAAGRELVTVRLRDDGRRQLRVHVQDGRGYRAEPLHEVDILEDVIAYGFADVRAEAGRELILVTRTGAWSYSLTKRGYRGNIERLVDAPLLLDVPSPRALPFWPYVLEAPGGDRLLLPEREGFAVYGPRAATGDDEDGAAYERIARFAAFEVPEAAGGAATRDRRGSAGADEEGVAFVLLGGARGPLLPEFEGGGSLLSDTKGYAAPALADVNGDGAADLVLLTEGGLQVHLSRAGRFTAQPDRVEAFPDYLSGSEEEQSPRLRLVDLDGDGDPDVLATIEREADGFADSDVRVLLLINDGRRLLPEKPNQVMRFETASLRIDVVDANADGRPDLSMRKFNLPTLMDAVTGLEFSLTYLVYFGEKARDRVVARKPALKQTQTFDENGVAEVIKFRRFELDCSGDGRPDLVEIDLSGRIAIRRLVFDSGFFSGDTWELERDPWKRFDTRGDVRQLDVLDLNGDGLADIASRSDDALTLFMSRRTR
ncbi:FG-GAP repeat protein [Planctomycetes bacterium Pla163]|uniref:FG-GAP repeat protein n=1 Tax=Rohdeia mirabilis TaxID=2528008 RepID=A0A518CUW2_9BACT|nr:FG-GAP repeat protein [Planctomycetes bacterium Pla163]